MCCTVIIHRALHTVNKIDLESPSAETVAYRKAAKVAKNNRKATSASKLKPGQQLTAMCISRSILMRTRRTHTSVQAVLQGHEEASRYVASVWLRGAG